MISGTGRAGTTFVVKLLTALGQETGFKSPDESTDPVCHAGMEHDLFAPNLPKIIKSPFACDLLERVLHQKVLKIEHLILPVRDLYAAAESRRAVSRWHGILEANRVPGGLWDTEFPEQQESVLAEKFYRLLAVAARYDIPVTLLDFPRMVQDEDYLWGKLCPIFPELARNPFVAAFRQISKPELVHSFGSASVPTSRPKT